MNKAGLQPTLEETGLRTVPAAPRPQRPKSMGPLRRVLAVLASLRVTVVLFALSILLVFFGTLTQMDQGLWTVLHQYFRTGLAWIPLQIFVRFGQVFLGVPRTATVPGNFPFPGGWLLGGLLLANLLAAHLVRFKLSWKRAGVLVLHTGLVIMMLSELVTGLFAVEARMTIEANGSSNYVEDHQGTELAIVSPANSRTDDVVAIPGSMLRKGGLIENPALPFDVEVVRYLANSTVPQDLKENAPTPATAGDGLKQTVSERPQVTGVDQNQPYDMPSAYVQFKKKGTGESLGTYLVSMWWSDYWLAGLAPRPQHVQVDGKAYEVSFRFQRAYKPYTIRLLEFHHDKYMGTDIPKNFSSRVRLTDPARHEEREVVISMNSPLRYGITTLVWDGGETFYQSGFLPKDKGTVLQVVHNPGWLMPYLSCLMVSLGMAVHFGLHLVEFLRRRLAL